jgi:hypothetical protein
MKEGFWSKLFKEKGTKPIEELFKLITPFISYRITANFEIKRCENDFLIVERYFHFTNLEDAKQFKNDLHNKNEAVSEFNSFKINPYYSVLFHDLWIEKIITIDNEDGTTTSTEERL